MGARLIYDGSVEVSCIETFTCPHHNTVHDRYTADGRKRELPYCKNCRVPVCELCIIIESQGGNSCIPYEVKLDRFESALRRAEQRGRFLSAVGL